MSNDKKDLTRIEDLGEFLHELQAENDLASEDFTTIGTQLPDAFSEGQDEPPDQFDEGTRVLDTSGLFDDSNLQELTDETFEAADAFDTKEFLKDLEDSTDPQGDIAQDFIERTGISFESPDLSTLEDEFIEEDQGTQIYVPPSDYESPENFEDVRTFSESTALSESMAESNPSFTVFIRNVRYVEDVEDIIQILKENHLLQESEEQVKSRMMRGSFLIPRISEYAAIYLAHKLRRFDLDLQVGLTDEVNASKSPDDPSTGLVTKRSLYQNQSHHFQFNSKLDLSQIIVAATPGLEGYQVVKYMGVASEHKMLDSHAVEDENSTAVPHHYQELAQRLKAHALKNHSNAVVGLNYQLTPIPGAMGPGYKYRLTCTGNLVWVTKV